MTKQRAGTTALDRGDIETAIKYAEVIVDAWIR